MFDKRNRWIITAIMGMATLAFVGISVLPLLGAFQNNPQVSATPSSFQERLETEAKGYELVLEREPDNQAALRGLLEVRVQQGNLEAVLPILERLAEQNPDQPDYTVLLAQTKQRLGDLEGAAQSYRSVLETRPGDINALKGLSELLTEQGRSQAAIGLLEDTLQTADEANRVQPGSIDVTSVRVLLGEVYFQQQRYDEAIATYDQATQINPQDFRPILGKALVLQAQGKSDEAAPLFASAEALAPDQYKDQVRQLATAPSPSPQADSTSPATTSPDASASEVEPSPEPAVEPEAEAPAPEEEPAPAE
ncbi:MAG: tetratricopeptide repeat protein [Elainellaceae cyanobacterium]